MKHLSANPSITPEFVERNLTLPYGDDDTDWEWDVKWLSMNPSITPEFIESHPGGLAGEEWSIYCLSSNSSITPEFVEDIQ
jgi:hypothetical protein